MLTQISLLSHQKTKSPRSASKYHLLNGTGYVLRWLPENTGQAVPTTQSSISHLLGVFFILFELLDFQVFSLLKVLQITSLPIRVTSTHPTYWAVPATRTLSCYQ